MKYIKYQSNEHTLNLKIKNELKKGQLALGAFAGISFLTITGGYGQHTVHADSTASTSITASGEDLQNDDDTDNNNSQAQSSNLDNNEMNAASKNSDSSEVSEMFADYRIVGDYGDENSAAQSTSENDSNSSSDNDDSYNINNSSTNSNDSSVITNRSGDADDDQNVKMVNNGEDQQILIQLRGKYETYPYVVIGSNGQVVTLPNQQQVLIQGNQLLNPTTHQSFNNDNTFDAGDFQPSESSHTVNYKLRFVDKNGKAIPYANGSDENGILEQAFTVSLGFDGEPIKLYYKDLVPHYNGFTPEQIANQVDSNGDYIYAILNHGFFDNNDTITLKQSDAYAHIKYYYTDKDGIKHWIDGGISNGAVGNPVDYQTPFNKLNESKYFNIVPNISTPTYEANTTETNPSEIDIPLEYKEITQKLPIIVKSVDGKHSYNATITISGNYGEESTFTIHKYNIQFPSTNANDDPLEDPKNEFLSNGINIQALLGIDKDGNLGNDTNGPDGTDLSHHLWTMDDTQTYLKWDNSNPNNPIPIVFYQSFDPSPSDLVGVPNIYFDFRFWGPKNADGSGYDPSAYYNDPYSPYNASNYNQTGLDNGHGAINYRTIKDWKISNNPNNSNKSKIPVNTFLQESPWSFDGFSTNDSNNGENDYLIQITKDGPVRIKVTNNTYGLGITSDNGVQYTVDKLAEYYPGAIYDKVNGVEGYYVPDGNNGKLFYPMGVNVLKSSNGLAVYKDGNYYANADSTTPLSFEKDSQQLAKVNGKNDYYIGSINNYAQKYDIDLRYLDANDSNGQLTNNLINGGDKHITAYTEDRIYYDPAAKMFKLSRYGKDSENGSTPSDVDSQTQDLFAAPNGWDYDYSLQTTYANYNYQKDASKEGGQRIASWIVGADDSSISYAVNTEMHPYGPTGTDNTVAVYMTNGDAIKHSVQLNVPFIDALTGQLIYREEFDDITYDPNTFDVNNFIHMTKQADGVFKLGNGYQFPSKYNRFVYVAKDQINYDVENNRFLTDAIYLLPYDPAVTEHKLTVHYVDDNGHDLGHEFTVNGYGKDTVDSVLGNNHFWNYGADNWNRVGIKLKDLNTNYLNIDANASDYNEEVFHDDSLTNNHLMFGLYKDVYIVLNKKGSNPTPSPSPTPQPNPSPEPNPNPTPSPYPTPVPSSGNSSSGSNSSASSNSSSNSSTASHSASSSSSSSMRHHSKSSSYSGMNNNHSSKSHHNNWRSSTTHKVPNGNFHQPNDKMHGPITGVGRVPKPDQLTTTVQSSKAKSAKLPQTGDSHEANHQGIVGLILLAIASFILRLFKPKKNHK